LDRCPSLAGAGEGGRRSGEGCRAKITLMREGRGEESIFNHGWTRINTDSDGRISGAPIRRAASPTENSPGQARRSPRCPRFSFTKSPSPVRAAEAFSASFPIVGEMRYSAAVPKPLHPKATAFQRAGLFACLKSFQELEARIADLPNEQARGAA